MMIWRLMMTLIETLRVEFRDLSKNEQEPSLTILHGTLFHPYTSCTKREAQSENFLKNCYSLLVPFYELWQKI